jgi:hypothetical protein
MLEGGPAVIHSLEIPVKIISYLGVLSLKKCLQSGLGKIKLKKVNISSKLSF